MPFYYVMYTMNPHLHSAHHNMKQGLYPVWMEEYTEPFAIASAHLFGSLGGSDCVETSRLSFHPVRFWAVVG